MYNKFKGLSVLSFFAFVNLQAQNERWVYYYDGQQHCSDIARAVVYGIDGNPSIYCLSS